MPAEPRGGGARPPVRQPSSVRPATKLRPPGNQARSSPLRPGPGSLSWRASGERPISWARARRADKRSVFHIVGLVVSAAVALWIAIDALQSASSWSRRLPVASLGASAFTWCLGELLTQFARNDGELAFARRVMFLGGLLVPVAWLWIAAQTSDARWLRPLRGRAIAAVAVFPLLAFSTLFMGDGSLLSHVTLRPPQHGPLFWYVQAYLISLVIAAAVGLVRTGWAMKGAAPLRTVVIVVAAFLPVACNLMVQLPGAGATDPTPIVVGLAAAGIRLAVFDAGLGGFLPFARRDIIEYLDAGVLVADVEGRVIDANAVAGKLVGDWDPIDQSLEDAIARAVRDPERAIEVRRVPVVRRTGEVGSFVVFTDRTEARRLERQLLLAHKLEALGTLTAGLAHEVNNPLAFVHANLNALQRLGKALEDPAVRALLPPEEADLAAEAPDLISESLEGVERIGRIVRRLRGFARGRQDSEVREPVDLAEVATKACSLAGIGLPETAIRLLCEDAPRVHAIEDELVQIGLNLIVNAIQASRGSADIEVEVGPARSGARLVVRDRGTGISAESMSRLFDPFFTTKPAGEGTGLGLSLSFDLARRSGGSLEGRNREGGGAEFELWLPRC